jgi:hypothetical protein
MTDNLKSKIQNLKSEGSAECAGAGGQGRQITFWIFDFGFWIERRGTNR